LKDTYTVYQEQVMLYPKNADFSKGDADVYVKRWKKQKMS
jgi:DNA polymerase III alpha subunit